MRPTKEQAKQSDILTREQIEAMWNFLGEEPPGPISTIIPGKNYNKLRKNGSRSETKRRAP